MKFQLYLLGNLFAACLGVSAQQKVANVDKDDVSPVSGPFFVLGGEPFSMVKYVKVVDGTPYFRDEWMPGVIVMPGGTRYDSLQLKLDLLANEIHYLDPKGQDLIASNPVRELWLHETSGGEIFHFVHSSFFKTGPGLESGWYQQLATGTLGLLKQSIKQITETRPYSSATMEQRISSRPRYLLLKDNNVITLKSISEFPALFPGNKAALEQYISSQKLKGKSDKDYISLVNYYNSL